MTPLHLLSHHHHHLKHQVHHSKHHLPMEHITLHQRHPLAQRQPHHLSHHLSKTCHPCLPNLVRVLTLHSWVLNHHLPLTLSHCQETNILLQQTHQLILPHHKMGLWRTPLSIHHHLQILAIPFHTTLLTITLWGVLVVTITFISFTLFEMNFTSCLVTLSISLLNKMCNQLPLLQCHHRQPLRLHLHPHHHPLHPPTRYSQKYYHE